MSTQVRSDPGSVNRGATGIPASAADPAQGDGGARARSRASSGELVGRIVAGLKALVRQEAELARIELAGAASDRARGAGAMGAAGVIALFAIGFSAAAASAALAIVLPLWAALLIVGGAFGLFAIIALVIGLHFLKRTPLSVDRTQTTLKENLRWARAQIRR